jgi:hypothetical protein
VSRSSLSEEIYGDLSYPTPTATPWAIQKIKPIEPNSYSRIDTGPITDRWPTGSSASSSRSSIWVLAGKSSGRSALASRLRVQELICLLKFAVRVMAAIDVDSVKHRRVGFQ